MINKTKIFLIILSYINFFNCSFANRKNMLDKNKKRGYLKLKVNKINDPSIFNNDEDLNDKQKKQNKNFRKLYNFFCCIDPLGNNLEKIECSACLFFCSIYSGLLIYFSYLYFVENINWKWVGCGNRKLANKFVYCDYNAKKYSKKKYYFCNCNGNNKINQYDICEKTRIDICKYFTYSKNSSQDYIYFYFYPEPNVPLGDIDMFEINFSTLDECREVIHNNCSEIFLNSCYNVSEQYPYLSDSNKNCYNNKFSYENERAL